MKKLFALNLLLLCSLPAFLQNVSRPRLVVGIVVDQMRWDYLYRYQNRYSKDGGFARLLEKGFTCENTFIPYAPTVTACGHASIYTGSVPAINGITGNIWYDNDLNQTIYCTEDGSVKTVGSSSDAGLQSPRNLWTSTVGDELKLATNFRAKVVGVALKDRGSILPAGHAANAAYWYDYKTGKWVTSDYYMKTLPAWAEKFPSNQMINDYYKMGWTTLYPLTTYTQSEKDQNNFEARPFGSELPGFPYNLSTFTNNYSAILSTPYGNTLTAEFAKQAVINEKLGADEFTDLLAVSFSSPDYIGHAFGPNSVEAEDNYLQLDRTLGDFFKFLDKEVGDNHYTIFLTADHAVAHVPGFALSKKIPAGNISFGSIADSLNVQLQSRFGKDKIVTTIYNYQVTINKEILSDPSIQTEVLKQYIINFLESIPGIDRAFDMEHPDRVALPEKLKEIFVNGYNPHRSGQIQIMLKPQWLDGFSGVGTTHGLWNPYDSHIPLLWWGWGIKKGQTNREVYMTDIAPTLSALLHIQMPNGSIGKVIEEVLD